MANDYEIAGILVFEFGLRGALACANKLGAVPDGPLSAEYQRVAEILMRKLSESEASHAKNS